MEKNPNFMNFLLMGKFKYSSPKTKTDQTAKTGLLLHFHEKYENIIKYQFIGQSGVDFEQNLNWFLEASSIMVIPSQTYLK